MRYDKVSIKMELNENQKTMIKKIIGKCEQCGSKTDLEVHRIKRGGNYELRNIKIVCRKCHEIYHSNGL